MQVEELFPSPILTFENLITEDLNNEIIEYITVLHKLDPNKYQGAWRSDNSIFESPVYAIEKLKEKINEAYLEMSKYWFKNKVLDDNPYEHIDSGQGTIHKEMWAWAVMQKNGDYISPHVHSKSTFSGVYFIQVPDLKAPNGYLEFNNPVSGALQNLPFRGIERKLICPKERTLLLFPSYLSHWVHPLQNKITKPRLSIGIDIRLQKNHVAKGI